MSALSLVAQIFKPAADLIDNMHTSKEEKLQQKAILLDLQAKFLVEALHHEQHILDQQSKIVLAEAQSDSWLARNWRPITMLAFVVSVMAYWFGLTPPGIPETAIKSMFLLVQIGLGGYVVGRSAEKTAGSVVKALKEKDKT